MLQNTALAAVLDSRFEIPHKPFRVCNPGIHEDLYVAIGLYRFNQSGQMLLNVFATPGFVEIARLSAKGIGLFYQKGSVSLLGHIFSRCHTGNAASDHKGRMGDRHGRFFQGFKQDRLGNGHSDHIFRLFRGLFGVIFVYPGALVAYIGHLEQVFIDARVD